MRRLTGPALFVVLALLGASVALACGDKLLAIGRGIRFQHIDAAREANVVIYSAGPRNGATPGSARLQTTLSRAVHKLQLVQGASQLDQALKLGEVDVVLVGFVDLAGITRLLRSAPSKPVVLPILVKPSKAELAAAQREYRFALKANAGEFEYLAAIDGAMKVTRKTSAKR